MLCSAYQNGIIFHNAGDRLLGQQELFSIRLRGRDKRLNGHFLINFAQRGEFVFAAGQRKSQSTQDQEDGPNGCGIGFFLRNGSMDYLCDEASSLKIYATTTLLANVVKMGLREILDAVCNNCTPSHFQRLLPFAAEILGVLQTLPDLAPILPTVEEVNAKAPFSRFVVAAVETYHHYVRGPKGTNYFPQLNAAQGDVILWNRDLDTLPEASRLEWLAQEEEEDRPNLYKADQPIMDKLATAAWLRQNYVIVPLSNINKEDVHQHYLEDCVQQEHLIPAAFGRILKIVFNSVEEKRGARQGTRRPHQYTNLQRINQQIP